jgi:hypothetical protein
LDDIGRKRQLQWNCGLQRPGAAMVCILPLVLWFAVGDNPNRVTPCFLELTGWRGGVYNRPFSHP